MDVLVTGGAGYIGSTICSALEENGHRPIILDSLINGERAFVRDFPFFQGDIADKQILQEIKSNFPSLQAVIHCAALIDVPESMAKPDLYYLENVAKSVQFFNWIKNNSFKVVLFSSSAAVYGESSAAVVSELSPVKPQSPYAQSKLMLEQILADLCRAYPLAALALRYFNPIGTDPQYRSGHYRRVPSHLLGRLINFYFDRDQAFCVTGSNWNTRDGSGVRDYLHVWDVAQAHVRALEYLHNLSERKLQAKQAGYFDLVNLGSGHGSTVWEFVRAFEMVVNEKLDVKTAPARQGDIAGFCASKERAFELFQWRPVRSLESGISDSLAWHRKWFLS